MKIYIELSKYQLLSFWPGASVTNYNSESSTHIQLDHYSIRGKKCVCTLIYQFQLLFTETKVLALPLEEHELFAFKSIQIDWNFFRPDAFRMIGQCLFYPKVTFYV